MRVDPEPGATMSLVPTVSFFEALSSVGGFFFASAGGQCAFFEYLTEMEVPAEYPKTLALVTPSLFALYYATAAIMYSRVCRSFIAVVRFAVFTCDDSSSRAERLACTITSHVSGVEATVPSSADLRQLPPTTCFTI